MGVESSICRLHGVGSSGHANDRGAMVELTAEPNLTQTAAKANAEQLIDYVSGEIIPRTPEEEEATQPFSRQLVEDYGYPKSHIITRPQYRVKARPSDKSPTYPVDIAVFSAPNKDRDSLLMIVECKRSDVEPEEGADRQIFNYMNMSSATLGVWTNGRVREFWYKHVTPSGTDFIRLQSLPRFGESVTEIGKYRRKNLTVPRNLKTIFGAIRNYLAGNATGTTRDELLATQLIHIVFCKIYDERFTAPDDLLEFRYSMGESPEAVSTRIKAIFSKVKAKYSDVFEDRDEISLDDESLAHVVGELQQYSLTEAHRDAVGQAFEVFIGDTLKGGQGQFFTPRNVIRLMIALVDPEPDQLVIDPACGAAGFLVESLKSKWEKIDRQAAQFGWSATSASEERQSVAIKTIFGIEKDSFLAKVGKAYMAVIGDGKGGIFCDDSLELPERWKSQTRQHVSLAKFDVVLANPPFGKDIRVVGRQKLAQYELGHKYVTRQGVKTRSDEVLADQNPQILFIERCLQLLTDGGVLGIILPETYFHAPSVDHVRGFLAKHNIKALIDLPHNTFRPFNNAKCIAIILQKNTPQQSEIVMVAAEEMGHDHQGKDIFRYNYETHTISQEPWDDISTALDDIIAERESDYVFTVDAQQVKKEDIYIPRYYWPRLNEDLRPPSYAHEWLTIQDLIDKGALQVFPGHGSPPATYKGKGDYPYIRVKDIVNWEIYRDPTSSVPESIYKHFAGRRPLRERDVVYVSRGSYRIGDAAMVGPHDREVMLTREIKIFRVREPNDMGLDPFYFLYLLTTPQVAQQTRARVFMDTTLPNIGERYRSLKLPWARDPHERNRIAARVEAALTSRWEAMADIRALLNELGPENPYPDYE